MNERELKAMVRQGFIDKGCCPVLMDALSDCVMRYCQERGFASPLRDKERELIERSIEMFLRLVADQTSHV